MSHDQSHENYKVRSYVFTWNNPEFDEVELKRMIDSMDPTSYAFQHETGKECGTPHF